MRPGPSQRPVLPLGVTDLRRYHRQMLLPGIGAEGQERLLKAHVAVVGCGALGCGIADLLARAGVGTLTLIDRDVVELTNLQRQTLFDERDAAEGIPKAEAARRRLAAVNASITLHAVVADLTAANAESLLGLDGPSSGAPRPMLLLDGTDNFETRYLLNDLAVKHGLPYVYGGAVATCGMQMTIVPGRTACLRCLFPEPPPPGTTPTCDTAGVWGPVIGTVTAMQAAEAIRLITGHGPGDQALHDIDLWARRHRRIEAASRADCPCCALRRFEFLDEGRATPPAALCGQDAVQVAAPAGGERIDLEALRQRLAAHGDFRALGRFLVRGTLAHERGDNGAPIELTVFADGRAIVKGTVRPELARALYARFIGG